MKDFLKLIGWKELIVILLTFVLVRISIIIPFYSQWNMPLDISLENFIIFIFGICFLFAGNNAAIKFFDEKQKILQQNPSSTVEIKQYPDLVQLRGLWIVLWFVGIAASAYSCVKIGNNYYYITLAALTLLHGYTYASYTRYRFLLGNLSLSILSAAIIYTQLPHNADILVPLTYKYPNPLALSYNDLKTLFLFLAVIVFFLTMLRDVTGDVTNAPEDKQNKYQTIGVVLGINKSKTFLYVVSVLFILLCCLFLYYYRSQIGAIQIGISVLILIVPIIYYIFSLKKASLQTDFNYLYVFLGMIYISVLFVISFCKLLFANGISY